MKNPLRKRLVRELKKDWLKYLVILFLMSFMIGVASGVFVANDSMKYTLDESYEKYNIEDGHFELKDKASNKLLSYLEDGITIYEQFYKDSKEVVKKDETIISEIRLFIVREEVNTLCIMDGRLPTKVDEIAIDRSHADNVGIVVGDKIEVDNKEFEVVGLVAAPDYTSLFKNNADTMFNALTFDIAYLSEDAWNLVSSSTINQYAFKYDTKPNDVVQEKKVSDDLLERIGVICATGGYTDDKDKAEELSDNIEKWKDYLEEVKEEADALSERGEALKAREEELKTKVALIMSGDPQTLEEMKKLEEDGKKLQEDIDALSAKEDTINEYTDNLKELEAYEDDINELVDYVPNYANQAINFAKTDLGKDQAMMNVLVYIFIAVLAFVFAITTSNKIKEESSIIGTLRATGYTKKELINFYLLIPIVITIIACVCGNIFGYTYAKDLAVSLYYNSYSLLKYETLWNPKAFVITTIIPLVLMILVNFIVIYRLMKLSPLKFLRKDLSTNKKKKAMRLPSFSFMKRFRLRILFQNAFDYATLFLGILFIMILLGFAIGLPETISHYKDIVKDNLLANYQTILKDYKDEDDNIITTKEEAEKFSMTSLVTVDGVRVDEDISIYGYEDGSNFIKIKEDLKDNEVFISSAFNEKFGYVSGDEIVLKDKYENEEYTFKVKGIYNYPPTLAVFMPNKEFNVLFEKDIDSFSGYMSNSEIKDIDKDNIYTTITVNDVNSLADQLDHSMGGFGDYIAGACLIIGILVMYLLTKQIVEKNATSISMVKVLGYEDKEINSLYILLTNIVVVIFAIITSLLAIYILNYLFRVIMYSMSGWFSLFITPLGVVKMIMIILVAYIVVAYLDMRQIKKVPLNEALKNVE